MWKLRIYSPRRTRCRGVREMSFLLPSPASIYQVAAGPRCLQWGEGFITICRCQRRQRTLSCGRFRATEGRSSPPMVRSRASATRPRDADSVPDPLSTLGPQPWRARAQCDPPWWLAQPVGVSSPLSPGPSVSNTARSLSGPSQGVFLSASSVTAAISGASLSPRRHRRQARARQFERRFP
jgi:hypothetical protein